MPTKRLSSSQSKTWAGSGPALCVVGHGSGVQRDRNPWSCEDRKGYSPEDQWFFVKQLYSIWSDKHIGCGMMSGCDKRILICTLKGNLTKTGRVCIHIHEGWLSSVLCCRPLPNLNSLASLLSSLFLSSLARLTRCLLYNAPFGGSWLASSTWTCRTVS